MASEDYEQFVVVRGSIDKHVLRGRRPTTKPPPLAPAATVPPSQRTSVVLPAAADGDDGAPYLGVVVDGKYRIDGVLGSGGMGVVVAATHVRLGTQVAIKLLRRDAATLPDIAQRFLREARAASRLRSGHVCKALDVGQLATGEPYIVMERLTGSDLHSTVRTHGALAPVTAAAYILQACEALDEAHALGMIHRDLKPANLMLSHTPQAAPHVKVLDFGLATAASDDVDGQLTRANVTMGSPHYMPPEQLRSARAADARSDIWALGVTLYELVTGAPPFRGDTISALSLAITLDAHPVVPGALGAIIDRCLAKDPARRFQSIAELAAALSAVVAVPSPVRFPEGSGPLPASPRVRQAAVGARVRVALAIAGVIGLAATTAAVAAHLMT
jgi:serine/threonine-protein kinase|nr:serine/threonine-protein kinase [Kofleriaceae bacterium]